MQSLSYSAIFIIKRDYFAVQSTLGASMGAPPFFVVNNGWIFDFFLSYQRYFENQYIFWLLDLVFGDGPRCIPNINWQLNSLVDTENTDLCIKQSVFFYFFKRVPINFFRSSAALIYYTIIFSSRYLVSLQPGSNLSSRSKNAVLWFRCTK